MCLFNSCALDTKRVSVPLPVAMPAPAASQSEVKTPSQSEVKAMETSSVSMPSPILSALVNTDDIPEADDAVFPQDDEDEEDEDDEDDEDEDEDYEDDPTLHSFTERTCVLRHSDGEVRMTATYKDDNIHIRLGEVELLLADFKNMLADVTEDEDETEELEAARQHEVTKMVNYTLITIISICAVGVSIFMNSKNCLV